MTYQSKNSLSDFEFHDSFVKLNEFCNQELRLCANGLNLHKNAKQNEEGLHDLELGNAVIRFENATLQNIASVTSKDHCDIAVQLPQEQAASFVCPAPPRRVWHSPP